MRFAAVLIPLLGALQYTNADAPSGALYPPGYLPLVNRANVLLASGKFTEAAHSYTEAIELNPADYLLYYKRATAYLSAQRHHPALQDFQQVLTLTTAPPPAVHLHIARLHAKDGQFSLAKTAARTYAAHAPAAGDAEAADLLFRLGEAEAAATKAERARRAGLWTACVEAASLALQVASHASEVRGTRAECGIAGGDMELGVGDLSRLIHLSSPSPALFMRIFRLSYFFLPPAQGSPQTGPLATLKQCLYYDPDSKPCKAAHRLVKQLDKSFAKLDAASLAEDWASVISLGLGKGDAGGLLQALEAALPEHTAQDALRFPAFAPPTKPPLPLPSADSASPRLAHVLRALCVAHMRSNRARAGEVYCRRLGAMDLGAPHMNAPEGWGAQAEADAFAGLGEAALAREEWEEGVRHLERAFERGGRQNRDVHARLTRAHKLLKQSKQKDYYKVLAVSRDADAKTIKKAFRLAAKKAHPDKGGSEQKMAQVNEAYEVLSNPELRQRFDNGDDPNDPAAGQGGPGGHPFGGGFGGGHPFAQFFDQSGGGGYQFHFGGQGGPRQGFRGH